MLGDAFYKQFKNDYDLRCTDIDLNEDWLSYLDIRSFTDYRDDVIKFDPQYLFHLGAFTDLEYCELHPKEDSNFVDSIHFTPKGMNLLAKCISDIIDACHAFRSNYKGRKF